MGGCQAVTTAAAANILGSNTDKPQPCNEALEALKAVVWACIVNMMFALSWSSGANLELRQL